MNFFGELKRRNVTRVAGVYIVVGWILVQVATALEEAIGLPAWFDGLIVALLLVGLPVALIFAWAFELTPEGVVRTEAVPETESITGETGRKLDFALVAAVVALIIVIVWQQATTPDSPAPVGTPVAQQDDAATRAPAEASVAVLPFADLSPAGDQAFFSDGLTEEILNLLVRAEGIEVASRTSSFQFKNTSLGIPEIAAELNVRHVVEGSVRKSGETIRVTAQLIDALTDRHLWSDTYDRPLTVENLFEIQDDVSNSIFDALSEELGILVEVELHAKRTTDDVDAYALFLQARSLYDQRVDLDFADELLGQAVDIDPEFSEAWAFRSATQFLMHDYGYSDLPLQELHRRGLDYANAALALDPDTATAIAAIANIHAQQASRGFANRNWADILAAYTRALELDPRNPSALNWRGLVRDVVGDVDGAIADFARCVEVDKYYVPCRENLHWFLADTGQDEAAIRLFRESLDVGAAKSIYLHLGLLARNGHELMFKAATNDENALRGWRRHDELYEAYRNPDGDYPELIASLTDFFAANPGRDPIFMDTVMMALGGPVSELFSAWTDSGRKLRRTEEFKAIVRRSGVIDYWKVGGFPDLCRPVGEDDFECD